MPSSTRADCRICNDGPDRRNASFRGLGGSRLARLGRAIALLEGRLKMRLLHRSTRALHLTQFGETYLAAAVRTGKLLVLLAQYEPPPIPLHLVLPSARSRTPKQRAFVDFAAPRLRDQLTRAASEIKIP